MLGHLCCLAHPRPLLLITSQEILQGKLLYRRYFKMMRNKIFTRLLMATALLMLAFPVVASAQIYDRYGDSYDRSNRFDARAAIARLDNASARLQNDLYAGRYRRIFGFQITTVDSDAVAEVRDFRMTVRELRRASDGGRDLLNSVDEARMVLDRGM